MDIQTRCRGVLVNYESINKAYDAWSLNNAIEKISWSTNDGKREIWRPFQKGTIDVDLEVQLCSINPNYRDNVSLAEWWWYKTASWSYDDLELMTNEEFRVAFCE